MKLSSPRIAIFLATLPLLCWGTSASAQPATGVRAYLSAPGATSVPYNNTTVETFEGLAPGNRTTNFSSAIGTYTLNETDRFAVLPDDQYGSGSGQYISFGAQSGSADPITLTLTGPVQYFGFSWNAGDALNGITFYSGDQQIGRYTTADTVSLLANATVTSLNGTTYNSSAYRGKPSGEGAGSNTGEPYGFLSFFAVGGTFDRVVFDNSGSAGSGFETDNHTILTTAPTPLGSFVLVGEADPAVAAAPEPGSVALLATSILPGIGIIVRRKATRKG